MSTLYAQLRKAIENAPKSRYVLWKETGISQSQLSRFLRGDSGMTVDNIEKLIEALDLQIVLQPRASKRKGR